MFYCVINNFEESEDILKKLEEKGVLWVKSSNGREITYEAVKNSINYRINSQYSYYLLFNYKQPNRLNLRIWNNNFDKKDEVTQREFLYNAHPPYHQQEPQEDQHAGMEYNEYTNKWSWL